MSAFAAHLRKELRDQSPTLAKLAAILVAVTACAGLAMPERLIAEGQLVQPTLVLGGLIGAIAVALELVPGESQRGTLALLVRLPGGLRRAFWAKAATVVVSGLAFAALGFAAALLCWQLRFAAGWLNPLPGRAGFYPGLLVVALGVAFWVMAFASWMPRGLPALFLPPLLALPHVLVWKALDPGRGHPHGEGRVAWEWLIEDDLGWVLLSQPLGALAVGWASLVLGRRWSGGAFASARVGAVAALVALCPAWGTLAWRAWEWKSPPPSPTAAQIGTGWLGRGGRYAFVMLERAPGWPRYWYAFELATGEAKRIGDVGTEVHPWTQTFRVFPYHQDPCDYVTVERGDGSSTILDTRDLSVVGTTRHPFPLAGPLLERFRASLRASSTLSLPDGRRAWVLGERLELERADGGFESVELGAKSAFAMLGCGLLVTAPDGKYQVYDLSRRRLFAEQYTYRTSIVCLGERWLVMDRPGKGKPGRWELLDPDSGAREPLPEELATATVVGTFSEGRVLMCTKAPQRLVLATLPHGPIDEIALPESLAAPRGFKHWRAVVTRLASGETELRLALSAVGGQCGGITTFRPGDRKLGPLIDAPRVLGRMDEDTVLALDRHERSLLRVDLRAGTSTPLRAFAPR